MAKVIDIETIPNPALIDSMPDPEVKVGNLGPEKAAAKIADAKQLSIDKMALSWMYGRICGVGIKDTDTNESEFSIMDEVSDAEEIKVIGTIFDYLIEGSHLYRIATWNGYSFDIPFVYKRAAILNVELPYESKRFNRVQKKYSSDYHVDIMQELAGWDISQRVSLHNASIAMLGYGKLEWDHKKTLPLIQEGNGKEMIPYIERDVELTAKHYNKFYGRIF